MRKLTIRYFAKEAYRLFLTHGIVNLSSREGKVNTRIDVENQCVLVSVIEGGKLNLYSMAIKKSWAMG